MLNLKNIDRGLLKKMVVKILSVILSFVGLSLMVIVIYNYNYGGKVKSIIVNKDLPRSHIMTSDDIDWVYLDSNLVPDWAIYKKEEIIGQAILYPLLKGEIINKKYLNHKIDPKTLGTLVPYGKFGLMLTSDFFSVPLPKIKINDLITILESNVSENKVETIIANQKVYFVEYTEDGNPSSFLLALPSDQIEEINKTKILRNPLIVIVNSKND